MRAQSAEPVISVSQSADVEAPRSSNLFYQAATVLAILLFLISFWSC